MHKLSKGVLEVAFEHLRSCGENRRECIVYLTGPVDTPDVVDGLFHPRHSASAAGYQLDSSSIAELWRNLTEQRRSIRIQVHTHPGPAYHSSIDDAYALVHITGFLSLVIPNFARGPVGLKDAFLAVRNAEGRWVAAPADDHLEVIAA